MGISGGSGQCIGMAVSYVSKGKVEKVPLEYPCLCAVGEGGSMESFSYLRACCAE